MNYLITLVRIIKGKQKDQNGNPIENKHHYFASCCGKNNGKWEKITLPMLEEHFEKENRLIAKLKEKLGRFKDFDFRYTPFLLSAEYKLGVDVVEDILDSAVKLAKNPPHYFVSAVRQRLTEFSC